MRWLASRSRSTAGFSLVELLVVIALLGIIGGITATSIARGLRADAQVRSRIEAFEDMQIAMERVSREVRAANPILAKGDNDITVQVLRGDACSHFTYEVDGGQFIATEDRRSGDCQTSIGTSERILIKELDTTTSVFGYRHDPGGIPPADLEDLDLDEVAFVEITFNHPLGLNQRPVTVSSEVGIRNR